MKKSLDENTRHETVVFHKRPLRQRATVGEELGAVRLAKGLAITKLAQNLQISSRYLEALERGAYHHLPSLAYSTQYLKSYAHALGIPWKALQEKYHEEIAAYRYQERSLQGMRGALPTWSLQQKPLLVSRFLKIGTVVIAAVIIVIYFTWGLLEFLSPPELVVFHPDRDMIVTERTLPVYGKTEPEAIVEINGQTVSVKSDGGFSQEISLDEGLNTIHIATKTKHSQQRIAVYNILYKSPSE